MSRGCQEAPEAILPEIHGTCVILYFKDRLPVLIVECCLKFICHHRHIEIRGKDVISEHFLPGIRKFTAVRKTGQKGDGCIFGNMGEEFS